jgi:hypothetical protein
MLRLDCGQFVSGQFVSNCSFNTLRITVARSDGDMGLLKLRTFLPSGTPPSLQRHRAINLLKKSECYRL